MQKIHDILRLKYESKLSHEPFSSRVRKARHEAHPYRPKGEYPPEYIFGQIPDVCIGVA